MAGKSSKSVTVVTLETAKLAWATRGLQTVEDWGKWAMTLVEGLATSTMGRNPFADELMQGVHDYRAAEAERVAKLRKNRGNGDVQNVRVHSEQSEHSVPSRLDSSSLDPFSSLDQIENSKKEKTTRIHSAFEEEFEKARKAYPGTRRGANQEWASFWKKYGSEAATIVPLLAPAIEAEKVHKAALRARGPGAFCPEWAHFRTWINEARWTQELGQVEEMPTHSHPANGIHVGGRRKVPVG